MPCNFRFFYSNVYENLLDMNFHSHNSYELVYYVKGCGKTTIDGNSYPYREGTFSLTLPNHLHNENHEQTTEVIYINFDYYNFPIKILNGVYYDAYSKPIYRTLEKIKKEIMFKDYLYEYKIELLIQEILVEYSRILDNKNIFDYEKYKDHWLDHVINFIEENYSNVINMESLVEISGYSYHRFRHIFKEKTGMSPASYILNRKIEHSKEMLKNNNLSITEIANNCGFSNSCQYSISFKKNTGMAPREYRNISLH